MIPNPLLDGIFEIRLKSDFWLQQLFKNAFLILIAAFAIIIPSLKAI